MHSLTIITHVLAYNYVASPFSYFSYSTFPFPGQKHRVCTPYILPFLFHSFILIIIGLMGNLGNSATRGHICYSSQSCLKNMFSIFNIIPSVLLQIHLMASINYLKPFHTCSNISKYSSIYEKKYSKISDLVNNSNNDNKITHISSTKENIDRKYIVMYTSIHITHTHNE